MLGALCAVALVASPGAKAEPVKLAAPAFTQVNLTPELSAFYTDTFAQELARFGIHIITQSEIGALLGLERQKQLMGCADDASCTAELANALGVDGIVIGSVGKFSKSYQLNVKVLAAADGRQLGAFGQRVDGDEALLDALTDGARALAPALKEKLNKPGADAPVAKPADAPAGGARRLAWIPLYGGGGLFLLGSGVAVAGVVSAPNNPGMTRTGGIVAAVGLSAVAAGGLMYWLGGPSAEVQPVAFFGPGGGVIGIAGTLP